MKKEEEKGGKFNVRHIPDKSSEVNIIISSYLLPLQKAQQIF